MPNKSQNFDAYVSDAFACATTPGTEFSVPHGMGKVPRGYIIIQRNAASSLYLSGTPWDSTNAYFKSDGNNLVQFVVLFIG